MEDIVISEFTQLRHGENSHQEAYISPVENGIDYGLITKDRDLGYDDYLNLTEVVNILAEFFDVNAVAFAKEGKLFSVALGSSSEVAFEKAADADPSLIEGATVGFSKNVGLSDAKKLVSMKVKNIVATSYEKDAAEYLSRKNNICVVKINSPLQELLGFSEKDIKVTPFGYLVQEQNFSKLTKTSFKVAGKVKPSQQLAEDAIFAWKVAKHLKSRAITVVKDLAVKSVIQGVLKNPDGVEKAVDIACENSKDSVLALDGEIDAKEILNAAVQGRVGLIIESGNADGGAEFVKFCDKYGIALIRTGTDNNRY